MSAVDRIARAAVARVAIRLLERARAAVPADVTVERIDAGLVLEGRGLRERRTRDPRLRDIGR